MNKNQFNPELDQSNIKIIYNNYILLQGVYEITEMSLSPDGFFADYKLKNKNNVLQIKTMLIIPFMQLDNEITEIHTNDGVALQLLNNPAIQFLQASLIYTCLNE
jgi:hypothetical protein